MGYRSLVDKYGKSLFCRALGKLGEFGNEQDAEELEFDAILAIWESVKRGNPPKKLKAYLYAVLDNLVNDFKDRRIAFKRKCDGLAVYGFFTETAEEPMDEGIQERIILNMLLNTYIGQLSPVKQEYFNRRYLIQEKYSDIARAMNKNTSCVKVAIGRLENEIREYLLKEGYC